MKTVVQTGNPLSHTGLKSFLAELPSTWLKSIKGVSILTSMKPVVEITFHKKEKMLTAHVPSDSALSKEELLEDIAIALQSVQNIGHIPTKLSKSQKEAYVTNWKNLIEVERNPHLQQPPNQ